MNQLDISLRRVADWLSGLAVLRILDYLARLTVAVAVVTYFVERDDQRKAAHYQAWQVLNSAEGKGGNGGRVDALEDLNRDELSLAGVNLEGAWLHQLAVPNANLNGAILRRSYLAGADLSSASLNKADLRNADLRGANLRNARLQYANLSGARLEGANLEGAYLAGAVLHHANLYGASFRNADLMMASFYYTSMRHVDVENASFRLTNLTYANVDSIRNWQQIERVDGANLNSLQHPPVGFVDWAMERGAVVEPSDHQNREEYLTIFHEP